MTAISKYNDDEMTPARVGRQFCNLLKVAEEEATSVSNASQRKAQQAMELLDICDKNGMSHMDFIRRLNQGLDLAAERGNANAYVGLLKTWKDLIYDLRLHTGDLVGKSTVAVSTINSQKNIQNNVAPSPEDIALANMEAELARREQQSRADGHGAVKATVIDVADCEGEEA